MEVVKNKNTVVVIQKKIFICNCFWQIPIINGRRNLVLWFTSTIQIDNNGIKFNREICSTQLLITHWKCNEMWTNWLTKAFGRLSTRQLLTYNYYYYYNSLILNIILLYYNNIIQIIQLLTCKTIIKSVKKLSYQWNDQEQWNEKFETKQTKTYLWILYILTVNGK